MSGRVVVFLRDPRPLSVVASHRRQSSPLRLIVYAAGRMVSSPVGIGGFEEREFEGYSPAEEVAA
jgi:hypothetical protein